MHLLGGSNDPDLMSLPLLPAILSIRTLGGGTLLTVPARALVSLHSVLALDSDSIHSLSSSPVSATLTAG